MQVIVVGAGVSGLTAAGALAAGGAGVTVLEGRDRIGGRTWTAPVGESSVDLGASWVHGPFGNPLMRPIEDAGIGWLNDGAWGAGMAVHIEDVGWADGTTTATMVAARSDWDPKEAAAGCGDDVHTHGVEWYIHDRRLAGLAARVARFNLDWLEGALNIGGPPDTISLAGSAEYVLHPGGNLVPTGGYGRLVDHLAEGVDIRTGARVVAIEDEPGGVIVSTLASAYRADAVVITAPLGVLRTGAIVFSPGLPTAHRLAIDRLRMGTLEKVAFTFGSRFWPDDVRRVTRVTADRSFPAWVDMTDHAGTPTLVALFNPTSTPGLSPDPGGRAAVALAALGSMFRHPPPIAAHATDWAGDAFSRGSYSFVPVGASAADMRTLGTPVSRRVVLAGEHTVPRYFGTVHGAYVSGLEAARHLTG